MTTQDAARGGWRAAWRASAPPPQLLAEAEDRLRSGDLEGAHARARNSPALHLRVHLALLRAGRGAPLGQRARDLRAAAGAPASSLVRRLQGVPPTAPPSPGWISRLRAWAAGGLPARGGADLQANPGDVRHPVDR